MENIKQQRAVQSWNEIVFGDGLALRSSKDRQTKSKRTQANQHERNAQTVFKGKAWRAAIVTSHLDLAATRARPHKPHLTYQVEHPGNSEDHRTPSKVQISETLEPDAFSGLLAKKLNWTWNPTAGKGLRNPVPQSRGETARNRCGCFSNVTDEELCPRPGLQHRTWAQAMQG